MCSREAVKQIFHERYLKNLKFPKVINVFWIARLVDEEFEDQFLGLSLKNVLA